MKKSKPHTTDWPQIDDTGFVSQHDAEEAIATAHDYLVVIGADIDARRPKASGTRLEP
jgi:hypothetical protein